MTALDRTGEAGADTEPAFAVPEDVPTSTDIWLVRHGETQWSRSGRHTGRTDIDLTALGERQAQALRATFATLQPALVLSSPRRRAIRTAELAGLRIDAIDEDLSEWDYGDYEGLTSEQIRTLGNPGWTLFEDGVAHGETAQQIAVRADRVLRRALDNVARGPVVLFGHGHISRVLGARWIGLPVRGGSHLILGTAAVSQLGVERGTPVLSRWNLPNPVQQELPPDPRDQAQEKS